MAAIPLIYKQTPAYLESGIPVGPSIIARVGYVALLMTLPTSPATKPITTFGLGLPQIFKPRF